MTTNKPTFIVIEGIDGSGKTTQAKMLHEALTSRGMKAHLTREPSDGPVGKIIRESTGLSRQQQALMFAADRLGHLAREVMPNLRDGAAVICDRYDHSSIAYQTGPLPSKSEIEWVAGLNRHAMRPTLTIILDVNLETAKARIARRGKKTDEFEANEVLARAHRLYKISEMPRYIDDCFLYVDGNQDEKVVHDDIMKNAIDAPVGSTTTVRRNPWFPSVFLVDSKSK